jgi:Ni/Co efflux regulator RcnB
MTTQPRSLEEQTMKRITVLTAAAALVATPALGAWAAVAATDDHPARDVSHVRIADRRGEAEPGDDHGRQHHRGHGADDVTGHQRHSSEPEPGDDRGGQAEPEPGDDHGGQAEPEPGDDDGGHHDGADGGDDGGHHDGGDDGGDDGSGHH